MGHMKLDQLNTWFGVVANIGVLIGIAFLAYEIQVNTSAIQSASVQAITDASLDTLRDLASNKELANLRLTGDADPSVLSELESFQYFAYYRQHWMHFQNVHTQRDFGVLNAGIWDTYARIICVDIGVPGIRATWQDHAEVLGAKFVEYVESCPQFRAL